jgi:polyhydroxybutyrate depolymerase
VRRAHSILGRGRGTIAAVLAPLCALAGLALATGLGTGFRVGAGGVHSPVAGAQAVIYVPTNLPAGKVALLIALHGSGESPAEMEAATGFDRLARKHSFIVAYLASRSPRDNWILPSETTSIDATIERLEASEPIDPTRVYVTGFSSGGYESYRAGCLLSKQVTAIAPVGVSMNATLYRTCRLSRPVSALIVIGSADAGHYGGYGRLPSAPAAAAKWRSLDGCPAKPPRSSWAPGPTNQLIWTDCSNGSAVGLSVVVGGTHIWPGPRLGSSSPDGRYAASAAIWAFFSAHRAGSKAFHKLNFVQMTPQEHRGNGPLLTRNARSQGSQHS